MTTSFYKFFFDKNTNECWEENNEKIIASSHVEIYCSDVKADIFFQRLKHEYSGDYSYLYKIICNCKNDLFLIYKDNHPSLFAECSSCKKRLQFMIFLNIQLL